MDHHAMLYHLPVHVLDVDEVLEVLDERDAGNGKSHLSLRIPESMWSSHCGRERSSGMDKRRMKIW